jgi:NRAMP (natural resistance-associated macrophage protein)-like metal ion transporter
MTCDSRPVSATPDIVQRSRNPLRRISRALGPGLITGAADDDPSGVATYSIVGAQFGTGLLWTALLTWPLMAVVQMMCARIGMVTGEGLAGALRKKIPRPVLLAACVALLAANTINIGADLSGMADAAATLTALNSHYFVVLFGVGITVATIRLPYRRLAGALKWLALVLFAYVACAFYIGPDWRSVAHATFVPSMPVGRDGWAALVAILGTTISPYLFFWQASQEVEEEKALGRMELAQRHGATPQELADRRLDVGVGTLFSNIVMFFIILSTALTLHRHGVVKVETSQQVAEALRPLAGRLAEWLYAVGIVGVGLLAIPTLAGSAAYAFAETFGWRQGLDSKLRRARAFYGILILAVAAGIVLDFARVNPVKALFWTAVINGILAPVLLVGVLIAASDAVLMRGQRSSTLSRAMVGITVIAMSAAAIAMFAL